MGRRRIVSLGKRMRRLRTAQKMSQQTLADSAELSRGMVAQLEVGLRQSINVHAAVRIARALGVTVEQLIQ